MAKKIDEVFGVNQIRSKADIPQTYQEIFQRLISQSAPFPYTLLLLPDKWGFAKSNSKLVSITSGTINIFEKNKKEVTATVYDFQDISYIETGTILLYSWITIYGITEGKPSKTTLEYNTVLEKLFKPIVTRIRTVIHHLEETDAARDRLREEQAKFDHLLQLHYKFMNFGKSSLVGGERVSKIILQPGINRRWYFKFTNRCITGSHLTILADQELIFIKEEQSRSITRGIRYGGIWYYIALKKINRLSTLPDEDKGIVTLQVEVNGGEVIDSVFEFTRQPELNELGEEIRRLKK